MGDTVKKLYYLLLAIVLFIPINTFAIYEVIDSRCTNSLKTSLRSAANDVVYRLSKNIDNENVTYKAIFYNLTKDMYLSDNDGNKYSSNVIENLKPGSTIRIIIHASNNNYCEGYKIVTKIISIPYYNKYSKSELCNGYENYYLCKENSNVKLTEKEFEKKMNEYISSLKEKENEEIKPLDEDTKLSIIDYILEYKYFILGAVFLILITIVIVVINNKKKNRGIL